jgi:hypothetical protein
MKSSDFNEKISQGLNPQHIQLPLLFDFLWLLKSSLSHSSWQPQDKGIWSPSSITVMPQINEVTLKETHFLVLIFLVDKMVMVPSFHTWVEA